ncbi:MAG: ABC-type antimicrobial peptide transport system, ATPase component [candidate division CPR1 bacterium GW2011_GWC1_49_13]|uniref:ABC-type antimicrobial peptide transport system, ATPase component n=1 Tax=candidate division CPR1 bacterium GW2011_GWC1_49_13 TaxID=1618342 RepID=A0A0G1VHE3_9BACT|nr:MAG: ABC-type antimicrobial peptide transport system, ATPase component [candidate division CPR1 bacterium GW2011_GWC1_49_13]
MENIIEAQNLAKIYGENPLEVRALDGVNLAIKRGEAVSVMGPSGSGKTTLLNMLGALDKPTSGEVVLDGVKLSAVAERHLHRIRREKIGFIFQAYYLVPTLNALENVLVPTIPLGTNTYPERAQELLERVGLKERMHHKPSQLSGGEQQRVAIARALVNDPAILLADEPTGNLDSKTGGEIVKLLKGLNREKGTTLVVVTHEKEIARQIGRTINFLDGKVV